MNWFTKLFQPEPPEQEIEAMSYCVPESIFCAWTFGAMKKVPVRIAVQKLRPGTDHVQAEALLDGVWTPLTPHWSEIEKRIAVGTWTRHFDVEPYRYLTLQEWIDEQILFTEHSE